MEGRCRAREREDEARLEFERDPGSRAGDRKRRVVDGDDKRRLRWKYDVEEDGEL